MDIIKKNEQHEGNGEMKQCNTEIYKIKTHENGWEYKYTPAAVALTWMNFAIIWLHMNCLNSNF